MEDGAAPDMELGLAPRKGDAPHLIKFEIQLYKWKDGEYCIDVQVGASRFYILPLLNHLLALYHFLGPTPLPVFLEGKGLDAHSEMTCTALHQERC